MKRDSGFGSGDQSPLANSDFFRQVERDDLDSAATGATAADDAEAAIDALDALDEEPVDDEDSELGEELEFTETPEHTTATPRGGRYLLLVGWLLGATGAILTALASMTPDAVAGALEVLQHAGLQPIHLALLGVMLWLFGSMRIDLDRRTATQRHDFDRLDGALLRLEDVAAEHRERRAEEELSDAERLLLALERQDGKINNLTRATKLYGKPLVEISKQVSEVMSLMQDLTNVGEQVESLTEVSQRLGESLAEMPAKVAESVDPTITARSDELRDALQVQDAKLAEISLGVSGHARPLTEVSDQLGQIEERIVGLSNVAAGLKDQLDSVSATVDSRFGELTTAVGAGHETTAAPVDLAPVERVLEAVRRELGTLAARLAQLETGAVSRTPQSTGTAAAASPSTPTPPSPTPAVGPAGGLAQSIAGERQAPAKNVLGAIAKLKSMRG